MSEIRVSQIRSAIGAKPKNKGTLRALGLGRIGKSNELPDRPEIRGMIRNVEHLVLVEEITKKKAAPAKAAAEPKAAAETKKEIEKDTKQ